MPATELLFRNPAFGRFFAARACSFIGDGVAAVALILLVQGGHGTGVAVGALLLAQSLPRLLGPLAGSLPARRLMVGCDLGQALVFAAIALPDDVRAAVWRHVGRRGLIRRHPHPQHSSASRSGGGGASSR